MPETAYQRSGSTETVSDATDTNGVDGTNGNANVPERLAACAGHMASMLAHWDEMEATVSEWDE